MKNPVLPDAALDADIATIAQKGAGKTYANRGLVERLLATSRRVVVMDPLNSWWGLKARANGKPGYPVVVVGGPNADLPLDPDQGERLAAAVAAGAWSVVVDVSELRRGEMIRFSTAFLAGLYRLNRDPLWLVLEEADVFAPQQPMGDATRLLHEVDQIARRGRARGFRLWSITQRPAKLHKDVLTQTSTLIMMRIRSPQDRAAAEAWIQGNADAADTKAIVAELASLPVGEGYIWAPDLSLLKRVKFPPIQTLDTSATPQHGEVRAPIGKLAAGDVEALRMALSADQRVVDDKLDRAPRPNLPGPDALATARAEGRAEGDDAGFRRGHDRGLQLAIHHVDEALQALRTSVFSTLQDLLNEAVGHADQGPTTAAEVAPARAPRRPPSPRATVTVGEVGAGAQRLLSALAGAPAVRMSWTDVCLLAGMSPNAGYTRAAMNELKAHGVVGDKPDFGVVLADPTRRETLLDPVDIVQAWSTKLGGAAARILQHLWVVGPQTQLQADEQIGLSHNAGYTRSGWKALRKNNLIVEAQGNWDIAPIIRDLKGLT